ncbi:hypothetical protein J2Z60_001569 [Lactobacillus colini]|uniref:Uncharacterized protein n=1 Tax=Lactobacillus colini TaxID=1819254 RepID=A0ABS4MFC8_9LACO|nr:hypothetical protein [Lactobacillus colini]MBP2058390.1 hypothetical protein [Lactobacillus colini]
MEKQNVKKKIELITPSSPLDAGMCGPDGCVINWNEDKDLDKKKEK